MGTASIHPSVALAPRTVRSLQSKNEQSKAVVIQDAKIDGAVSRPSNEFVKAKMGTLSNDGNIPK